MVNIFLTFYAFFPSFISNTIIVRSINFGANLEGQNAGNGISVLHISNIFPHSCVVCWPHTWPSAIAMLL